MLSQVHQLGSGDVGLVDLVQLSGSSHRFALKSLEKKEMLERNKVGELGIPLSVMDSVMHCKCCLERSKVGEEG